MKSYIKIIEKPKLRKPVMVAGMPGVGNVGRVAAGYMVAELKMKKMAELYSPHFLHLVVLEEGDTLRMLRCEFYYIKGKKNDIVVLTGDTQSVTTEGHYEFCESVLEYAKKIGVKDVITIGGFSDGKTPEDPRVIGAADSKATRKKYDKYKIDFGKDHPVGTIVGASGMLAGMAERYGMSGLVLMGETMGMPFIMDPKAADRTLHSLIRILGINLDLGKLENTVKEMEERLKKTEEIHKNLLRDMTKSKDDVRYIG
ncbi:MAG TPA: proteasome assembly chaperone family protein [archaeon]|nr:proteasome assembly chaperone family protein [archaeon]